MMKTKALDLFFDLDNKLYLLFLLFLYFLTYYLLKEYIETDELVLRTFKDQLTEDRLSKLVESKKRGTWIYVPLFTFLVLLKIFGVALCLYVGIIFSDNKVKFRNILHIVLISEGIFLLSLIVKLLWFMFFVESYSYNEYLYFTPLSILNLFDLDALKRWDIYALAYINLFQFIYILFLSYGLKSLIEDTYINALSMVLSSYGVGLLFWIVFICFLLVSIS